MIEKKIRIKSLEELINQPRLVKYDTYEFDELSYTCLLVDIKMLLEENKKYKEVIQKAINKLEDGISFCKKDSQGLYDRCNRAILREQRILDILKEVKHEKSNN